MKFIRISSVTVSLEILYLISSLKMIIHFQLSSLHCNILYSSATNHRIVVTITWYYFVFSACSVVCRKTVRITIIMNDASYYIKVFFLQFREIVSTNTLLIALCSRKLHRKMNKCVCNFQISRTILNI